MSKERSKKDPMLRGTQGPDVRQGTRTDKESYRTNTGE